jgi:unsaturated rhamnogalacturonyl hydrolase
MNITKPLKLILLFTLCINNIYSDPWSEKIANSVMEYRPIHYGYWDYVTGTVLRSFQELYLQTNNEIYLNYIKNTVDYVVNNNGIISGYKLSDYNLDNIKEGCSLLFLYKKTGLEKYKIASDSLRKQLQFHPRTSDSGYWHKLKYPYQMWLDGLYMAEPFYAEYSVMFNDAKDFDDITKQFILMEKHARDSVTGLLYHGWDEKMVQPWANPVTGCSASFWGRALGWYMMAIVDVLDFMPINYSKRDTLISILNRLVKSVIKYQDVSGCWFQVVDQGTRQGNYLEASVTCMFAYSILKAVRLGYIDSSYIEFGINAFNGIINNFIVENNGKYDIKNTCCSAGLSNTRNGTFEYYISEPKCTNDGKAIGPFILASLEIEKLNHNNDTSSADTSENIDTTVVIDTSITIIDTTVNINITEPFVKRNINIQIISNSSDNFGILINIPANQCFIEIFSLDGKKIFYNECQKVSENIFFVNIDNKITENIYILKVISNKTIFNKKIYIK